LNKSIQIDTKHEIARNPLFVLPITRIHNITRFDSLNGNVPSSLKEGEKRMRIYTTV